MTPRQEPTDQLTDKQRAKLKKLQKAYDKHGGYDDENEDEIQGDWAAHGTAYKRFAYLARAADRCGLLEHPDVQNDEAVRAAKKWLPVLEARRKHRRLVMPDNGSPKRKLWSKHWKWLSKRVNCLHRKGHNQKSIRDQLVQELEEIDTVFACQLKKISQQAWNKRFSQLFHAETPKKPAKAETVEVENLGAAIRRRQQRRRKGFNPN